ncbi:MAG TPA: Xaa-Pro peptidase family protein [Syntrophomonadaceae bacterium]|nr:Xaa-Pro peptidase family protein [Syntrophomonadaceae bacterium]
MRFKLEELGLKALLITKAENIRYISGFTGGSDAKLLLSLQEKYIITDARYTEQVGIEAPGWELMEKRPGQTAKINELLKSYSKLGFETSISYNAYLDLQKSLGDNLVPTNNIIEDLRQIKSADELDKLRKTALISDEVFKEIGNIIKPGISEKTVANHIVFLLKDKGCQKEAFDTIAVAGENAALPHGQPTDRILQKGDMLTMDYGGFYHGYAGDMTRTVAISHATDKFKDLYKKVLEAQKLGVKMVQAGVMAKDIDMKVRAKLEEFGLGKYFHHSTGHGLGLEVHELPSISSKSDIILQENMVITIEPGIYIKGWGGIRIEDTVIVKKDGCEIITHSDKELTIF